MEGGETSAQEVGPWLPQPLAQALGSAAAADSNQPAASRCLCLQTHFDGAATLGQGGATEAQAGGEAGTAQPVEVDAPPPPHELAAELEPAASGEGVPEAPAEAPAGPGATVEQPSAPAQPEVMEEAAAGDAGELPAGGDALEAAAQGAEEAAKQEAEVKPEAGADVKQEGEGAAAEGPAPPSDEALAARLTELLREADLTTVTGGWGALPTAAAAAACRCCW